MNAKNSNNSLLYRITAIFMIVMMLLAAMSVASAQAAPLAAVGVGADFGAANVAQGTGAMTAITGTYAVGAGTNRLLVVAVLYESQGANQTSTFTSGSYGGQALTSLTLNGSGVPRNRVWVGYLKEAGIAAAANTTLNLNIANSVAPNGWVVKAAWFNGIDQTTPINSFVNGGNENPGSATHNFGANLAVINGGRAIYFEATNQDITYTPPAGYTENFDANYATNNFRGTAGSKAIVANGNENPNIVQSAAQRYIVTAISLNPASALPVAPAITSANAATFTVGIANTFTVTATGSPAPTFTATGALPTGVTLSAAGVLSGTPAAGTVGAFPITITASNGTLPNATQAFTLTVQKAATTTTISSDLPDPSAAGQNVVVNYTVASAGNAIARTGNVTVSDGVNNCVGTAAAGTCTLALTTAGARTLTATYAGDVNFNGSASAGAAHTVSTPACSGSLTYNAPAGTNRVVVVVASDEPGTPISNVQIGGTLATNIATVTNGAAQIYVGYRVIGTSAVPQAMNITSTGATCTFAVTYQNINQTAGNGAANTINSIATGTANNGTTTTGTNVFNAAGGAVNNVAGGQVLYAINMNQGSADGQVDLGTAGAVWTFTELMDKYEATNGNRTGVGQSNSTSAGSSTVSVTATTAHNRSVLAAFSLNPLSNIAPAITSANATTFTAGIAGTFNVTATGSPAPTFAVTTGTLPTGVTLSAAGVLSGTPAAGTVGSYPITITASNGTLPNATQVFTLTVQKAATTTTISSDLPDPSLAGQNVVVNYTVASAGNAIARTGNVTVSDGVNNCVGTAAAGTCTLALTTAGARTLTATYAGDVNFNGSASAGTAHTVNSAPPVITSAAPSNGTLGIAYSHTYTATGTTPITFSVTSGALPTGLTLTPAGVLSGTPTVLGTFNGIVTATNGIVPDATQNFSITISLSPTITSLNNTSFTIGVAGSFTVTATGTPAPTLSMTGALPTGVTFNAATGVLAGTPAAGTAGSYPLVFTATNGVVPDAVQNFTLTVTQGPSITSANTATFSLGLPGSFTVTAVGSPAPTLSMVGTLPAGVTFTPATGILSGTPTAGGVYPLIFNAVNGVLPNGTQNFTLTVKNGPIVAPGGVNSVPDTGNGSISENESILNTLGVTKLKVQFDQDVLNVASTDPDFGKSVINPANYMLVMGSATGVFQTVSCLGGVQSPDVAITVDSVTYTNGGGVGPFVATLNVNSGLPLNVIGYYRLYVCGTTSIVDAANINLKLAGNGSTPGTDFALNFRIQSVVVSDPVNSSNTTKATKSVASGASLIPVTGFAPSQVTLLPAQPANKAYKPMNEIRIEIPTLGINYPIVGVMFDKTTWDLTWLKDSVAYLEGSAYPTLAGNTVLTAHVVDANNNLGPFSDIKGMQSGQKVYIHAYGQVYVYQVQENRKLSPTNVSTVFQHEDNSWVTLVTCEDFNAKTGLYNYRRMVRAVLISVVPEKK